MGVPRYIGVEGTSLTRILHPSPKKSYMEGTNKQKHKHINRHYNLKFNPPTIWFPIYLPRSYNSLTP